MKPSFSCPELQESFLENRERISKFQNTLDSISEDIRKLEAYLKESSINIPFTMIVDEILIEGEIPGGGFLLCVDEYAGRPVKVERHALLWKHYGDQGYRLLYNCSTCDGEFDGEAGRYPWTVKLPALSAVEKPLIEAPLEIRLDLYKSLPRFVKELADSLPPLFENRKWGDEIPF